MSQGRGSKKHRGHHSNKDKINIGDKGKEVLENIDESNPVIQQFRVYAASLDEKHDRYESIIKINRDITIESKRIIFLLHTIDKESKRDVVLAAAKSRLDAVARRLFRDIAHELDGQDAYQFHKAYRAGMEEYVEALTFYEYLENGGCTHDWTKLEETLTYHTKPPESSEPSESPDDPEKESSMKITRVLVTPTDYIMGMADLTGELMRRCINNLAIGDITSCYHTCNFVRHMYVAFLGYTSACSSEIHKKVFTLKQSLAKMEKTCYTIKVRGSEVPKHMLADVAIRGAAEEYNTEDDEGYQAF
ncbi:translin-associated protein X [Odontomachus brunneus]|uniref:translin-associated protein X n=1 Tax=Odontomachus brunneus TaxID=486640 RepID=UPI0013F1BEAA|nr:translin-associated protein X [Odontomachus brunneus]XP_032673725.1 translin-associated protein X [Odontomachus brunneus]